MSAASDIFLECDDKLEDARIAIVAAEFVGAFLFHRHRGVIDCNDRFIIFGNDGYTNDPRSQREAEIVLHRLPEDNPVLGIDVEGCSWAIVVTDYSRTKFDEEDLDRMVWDAWMQACDEAMANKAQV
jgi:hypothetical protein